MIDQIAENLMKLKLSKVSFVQTTVNDALEFLLHEYKRLIGQKLKGTFVMSPDKRSLRISYASDENSLLNLFQFVCSAGGCDLLIRDVGLVFIEKDTTQPPETFMTVKPDDVFTPRLAEVNAEMYVARPRAERALRNALRGTLHMIIHGESGTGKSWLYKKTFRDEGIPFQVANLANASRLGSICGELKNLVDREEQAVKTKYDEEASAGINLAVAKSDVKHKGQFEIGQLEPFELCLRHLHKHAKGKTSVLVFDNLEAVFEQPQLLKELADLIILCDDQRYAAYKVKILIVGVPSDVKEYFYRTPHLTTVANRVTELPEVTRLEKDECESLIKRGLTDKLRYYVPNIPSLLYHIAWITDRVPQVVHEYCLELANLNKDLCIITSTSMMDADDAWMWNSLYYAYGVVESHMNERDTKTGRRNQTLYALALCAGEQFRAQDVEELVRNEFPVSTEKTTALNIPQILSQLSAGEKPLIRRSPKGNAFFFKDPRHRMVLRAMLIKTTDERVEKRPISRGQTDV